MLVLRLTHYLKLVSSDLVWKGDTKWRLPDVPDASNRRLATSTTTRGWSACRQRRPFATSTAGHLHHCSTAIHTRSNQRSSTRTTSILLFQGHTMSKYRLLLGQVVCLLSILCSNSQLSAYWRTDGRADGWTDELAQPAIAVHIEWRTASISVLINALTCTETNTNPDYSDFLHCSGGTNAMTERSASVLGWPCATSRRPHEVQLKDLLQYADIIRPPPTTTTFESAVYSCAVIAMSCGNTAVRSVSTMKIAPCITHNERNPISLRTQRLGRRRYWSVTFRGCCHKLTAQNDCLYLV